jgi:hypothetical protein
MLCCAEFVLDTDHKVEVGGQACPVDLILNRVQWQASVCLQQLLGLNKRSV